MTTTARPASLAELAYWAADAHPDAVAQRWKAGDAWRTRTYAEVAQEVRAVAAGLAAAGVGPGDRVGLLCATRPEWTVCDLAIGSLGAIPVPIYPTNSAPEIEWVLGDSGARAAIVETADHLAKVTSVRAALPSLDTVIGIDVAGDVALSSLASVSGASVPVPAVGPGDTATIMYTSGTTGNPKGCQLSHGNWRAMLDTIEALTTLGAGDVVYVYLPLAHMFTRMVQIVAFETGATLGYTSGDIRAVVGELSEIRPTHLPSVPRLFEKVYAMVADHVAGSGPDEQRRLAGAVDVGLRVRAARARGESVSPADAAAFDEAEARLFAIIRGIFGGEVREALTGAAPIAADILRFFFACGVPIFEAYGMTEATAVISANRPGAVRFGSVGQAVDGVEIRIAPDGEICSRSDGTFTGYWNNPAASAEIIVDGWLHTGDLGRLDPDGYLYVTGRKKDIIITSGGKNLTPANLENDVRRCRLVADAVMCGDRRPYPVLLVTLDVEQALAWATSVGLPEDLAVLARDASLRAVIQSAVDDANTGYAPPEQVRTFAVLERPFSIDDGELTPTLKVRRAVVTERYADVIDSLYR
jgi:long-chain acyl-CoA synthetase